MSRFGVSAGYSSPGAGDVFAGSGGSVGMFDALERSLVADVRLSGRPLVLSQTLDSVHQLSAVVDHHVQSETGTRHLFAAIGGVDADVVEAALDLDSTVETHASLATFSDCQTYQLDVSHDAMLVSPTAFALGGRALSVTGTDGQWHARIVLPTRERLTALRTHLVDHGVSFSLDRLFETTDAGLGGSGLTDLQRTTLRTAYEKGYYDVPRRISQHELADLFGVSTSAISNRLRRATAQLIRTELTEPSN